MANGRDKRRLAAILAADIVGYSRLMEADESGTIAQLKALRKELIDPKVEEYSGRIVKTTGDGILIEFSSVIDAVQNAVDVQREIARRNEGVPEDLRIVFRVGINQGDIVVDGEDILGDGVNIAARLEAMAEPGGICISLKVRDEIRDKLAYELDDLGEVEVKNISRPVRAFSVKLGEGRASPAATPVTKPETGKAPREKSRSAWLVPAIAAPVILIALIGGGATWNFAIRDDPVPVEVANVAGTTLALPDKPSIAVLPFDNLSNDPEQEYFADGMADTLLTDLSRLSGLIVIARNSSFAYKGKAVDVRQVGLELGVKFVLEGSVLRVGDRIRINAQLVDASTGAHIWAGRYDGTMEDVFALQDQVIQQIVSELAIKLTGSGETQVAHSETDDPEAYDAFLKGWALLQRGGPDRGAAAIPYFEQAVRLDPEYGRAHAALALTYQSAIEQRWVRRLDLTYGEANDRTKEYLALAMERPTALAYRVSALAMVGADSAVMEAKRGIELEPNNADGYLALAQVLVQGGEHEEALDALTTAKRLDPQNPRNYDRWGGQAQFLLGHFEDAAATLRQVIELDPEDLWSHMWLGVAYAELGREDEGREEIVRLNAMRKERSGKGPISTSVAASFHLLPADTDKLRASLGATGVRAWSGPPRAVPSGIRLKGGELLAFLRLPYWYGGDPGSNTERWRIRNPQNESEMGGSWGTYPFRPVSIENDQICKVSVGVNICTIVYRNPQGTLANNDEYILYRISSGEEWFFSAYEERPPALKGKLIDD